MPVTSTGLGSGLDVEKIVKQLVNAETKPTKQRLDQQETKLQAEISAFGKLQSVLSSYKSALGDLTISSTFNARKATSSNEDIATADATSSAVTGSYDVSVSNLAKAHTLTTSAFSSKTEAIASGDEGTGTLTFKFGTTDTSSGYSFTQNPDRATEKVTIDSSNNSLAGIRDAINDADIGVSASIVEDSAGYKLALVSDKTGADNSMQVTVDEETGTSSDNTNTTGLSKLAFNASAQNMTEAQGAQDASLTVNGISLSSESNTVDQAIEGVTIELEDTGSTNVSVTHDKGKASEAVDEFVKSYNNLIGKVNQLTSFDQETKQAGLLLGDSTIRNVMDRIRGELTGAVEGLSGTYTSLASIGITTNAETGKLEKDDGLFQEAMNDNFDQIARIFSATGEISDSLIDYEGASSDTKVGEYDVSITQLATQGKYTGATLGGSFTIGSSSDELSLDVDGVSTGTLVLTQGTYDTTAKKEDLAAELQSEINGDSNMEDNNITVEVTYDSNNDRYVITSDQYGSDSTVKNISGTAASVLGLDSGTASDGVDVEGSIGGQSAQGDGQILTGRGDAAGLELKVRGGSTGYRGEVSFTRGYADQLHTTLSGFLGEDNVLDARLDGLDNRVDEITREREDLSERATEIEARYRARFNNLDVLIADLKATERSLGRQLSTLPTAAQLFGA